MARPRFSKLSIARVMGRLLRKDIQNSCTIRCLGISKDKVAIDKCLSNCIKRVFCLRDDNSSNMSTTISDGGGGGNASDTPESGIRIGGGGAGANAGVGRGGKGFLNGYFIIRERGTNNTLTTCHFSNTEGVQVQLWPQQNSGEGARAQVSGTVHGRYIVYVLTI